MFPLLTMTSNFMFDTSINNIAVISINLINLYICVYIYILIVRKCRRCCQYFKEQHRFFILWVDIELWQADWEHTSEHVSRNSDGIPSVHSSSGHHFHCIWACD